jgi:hypothetical protein
VHALSRRAGRGKSLGGHFVVYFFAAIERASKRPSRGAISTTSAPYPTILRPSREPSIEEQWLLKYSRPTKIKFVGVWDTVGSLGLPVWSMSAKIHKYKFLDTHLRLDNENAFHALALDEHRKDFEPTLDQERQNGPGRPGRSADRQGRAALVRWRACERRRRIRQRSACPTSSEVAHEQGRWARARLPRRDHDRQFFRSRRP